MDWVTLRGKIVPALKRYRYAILVVAIGLLLMLLPGGESSREETPDPPETAASSQPDLQQSLESILSQIAGAGKVEVLLTVATGEETIYQSDEDISNGDSSASTRSDTVLISGTDREETGLVRQVIGPVYQGAVIVCQGADNAAVRLAIVEAVSSVTGLGADRISVLKMK